MSTEAAPPPSTSNGRQERAHCFQGDGLIRIGWRRSVAQILSPRRAIVWAVVAGFGLPPGYIPESSEGQSPKPSPLSAPPPVVSTPPPSVRRRRSTPRAPAMEDLLDDWRGGNDNHRENKKGRLLETSSSKHHRPTSPKFHKAD